MLWDYFGFVRPSRKAAQPDENSRTSTRSESPFGKSKAGKSAGESFASYTPRAWSRRPLGCEGSRACHSTGRLRRAESGRRCRRGASSLRRHSSGSLLLGERWRVKPEGWRLGVRRKRGEMERKGVSSNRSPRVACRDSVCAPGNWSAPIYRCACTAIGSSNL